MDSNGQTWKEVVRDALEKLGGEGHLKEINKIVGSNPRTRTNPTWKETIRRVVRQYSIFEPVPPHRSGVYRLVSEIPITSAPENLSGVPALDHGTVQGMLLALGRIYGYETFAPATDRTSRAFQGRRLADLATVTECDGFCGERSLPRVRQIDAIWLSEDNDGAFPVYAFEVEHTTGVRSGMDRLAEIPARYTVGLFVVAPGDEEQKKFDKILAQARFQSYRSRMQFREYSQLEKLYNSAVQHDEYRGKFGVAPRRD